MKMRVTQIDQRIGRRVHRGLFERHRSESCAPSPGMQMPAHLQVCYQSTLLFVPQYLVYNWTCRPEILAGLQKVYNGKHSSQFLALSKH